MYANSYGFAGTATNNWGPIFCAPIVKDTTDPTNTLEVNSTFTANVAAVYQVLTSLEEQSISIDSSESSVITTPTI